ncbi:MAG: RNA polymerase sigma factor [bacterium]
MGPETEKEMVMASLGGDRHAYNRLVSLHSSGVFAVCLGILRHVEDAEDAAQDAFIRGFDRLAQLRGKEQFGPWIRMIARNLCIDHLRRENRRRAAETEHQSESEPDPGPGQDHSDLEDAVMQLPEDLRIPLLVYYFDGRSSESLSKMLNISKAGVLTRLCRARKELRRLLVKKERHV